MKEDLERSLLLARQEKELAQKLNRKLELTMKQLEEAEKQSVKLAEILDKEKEDVDKLEHLSLTGIFATILGTKEDKLEKECQEYLAAKLKYDASQKVINDLKNEMNSLNEELVAFRQTEERYRNLLREKEEVLKRQEGKSSQELLFIAEEEGRLAVREKELQEAGEAADKVMNSLDELIETLNSAANWGVWDMFGGGLIATAVKHSRIDDAREQINVVQRNLNRLQRELSDIKIYTELGIDIGGLAAFADYFFDGLITDWVVQSRINEAEKRAQELQGQVAVILHSVRNQINEVIKSTSELRNAKQLLIERSSIYNSSK